MSELETQNPETDDPLKQAFDNGELLVYPTEAVIGIGCDPDNEVAVRQVCQLKQRDIAKGVILVADNYSRVLKYVADHQIPMDKRTEIFSSWPGPVTWLLPKSADAPPWVTGEHDAIAIRVSAHPGVKALCTRLDSAIVSTSANLAGQEAVRTIDDARQIFGDNVIYIEGDTGGNDAPSIIKDAFTGNIIRG